MSGAQGPGGRGWLGKAFRAVRAGGYALLALPGLRALRSHQLRRLTPLAGGRRRGTPVIRHYWHQFLERHRADIRGRGLEIGGTETLSRWGGPAMTACEALDLTARPGVDVVADLGRAEAVPSNQYDCFVVPFTTHLIYDIDSALYHAVRILKPGGVLLVNFPCVDYYFPRGLDMDTGRPLFVFWWFTPIQVANLLRRAGLPAEAFQLDVAGNLFARVAYQLNMAAEELTREEREARDEGHPLLISARVVKPGSWSVIRPEPRDPWLPEVTPEKWNPVTGHYPPV